MIGFFIGNNFNAYFVLIEDSQHIRQRVQNPDSIFFFETNGTITYILIPKNRKLLFELLIFFL